jgi:hypothetical protein
MPPKVDPPSESGQSQFIVVLVTTASEDEATLIGREVVKQGLAA